MSTVQEIESAIGRLPREAFLSLVDRLRVRYADAWDQQIEDDAKSGRLDAMFTRLEKENRGQPDRPLDEVLDEGQLP